LAWNPFSLRPPHSNRPPLYNGYNKLQFQKGSLKILIYSQHAIKLVMIKIGVTTLWNSRMFLGMTIDEKINAAQDLFKIWGEELLSDAKLRSLMEALRQSVSASGEVNVKLGVSAACKHCEEEEGGSCCGAGIENRYTPHLLLINLLSGGTLPEERRYPNGCYFLKRDGCSLMARDILCINYLCARIQELLPHDDLLTLQAVTGDEMETVFLLHEAVKQFIRRRDYDH
jgi:hypothetical protein